MHEIVISELRKFQPLNLPEIDDVVSGKTEKLTGEARAIIADCIYHCKQGLDSWGHGYSEERKRQERKLMILNKALTA